MNWKPIPGWPRYEASTDGQIRIQATGTVLSQRLRTDDDYLVRQFGIVPTPSGQWGVALAARARDGVFETGVEVVNALADWLVSRLPGLARY